MGGVVGVACGAEHCNALWGLLSTIQTLKSHFLPFIGQEGPKLEMYDTNQLHTVYDTSSCLYVTFLNYIRKHDHPILTKYFSLF